MGFSHVSSVFTDIHYSIPPVTDWHHSPLMSVEHAHPIWPPIGCILHASHPIERLSQVLGPLSAISSALSAGTWEMFGWSPLSVSDYKKPEGCVKTQSGHSVTAFLFCSPHTVRDAGYSVTCWFPWFSLSMKDSSPLPLDHILSQSPTPHQVPFSEPNATSNPLYFLLLRQHHQFTGEISEAQRD